MPLDLGPVLNFAAGVVSDLLTTGGTTVDITRPGVVQAVDTATGAATTPASAPVASAVNALVLMDNADTSRESYPGAPPVEDPRWKVILPPSIVDIRRGDHIAVTASRDDRLTGRTFEVTFIQDGSPGVARIAFARALPVAGQS